MIREEFSALGLVADPMIKEAEDLTRTFTETEDTAKRAQSISEQGMVSVQAALNRSKCSLRQC